MAQRFWLFKTMHRLRFGLVLSFACWLGLVWLAFWFSRRIHGRYLAYSFSFLIGSIQNSLNIFFIILPSSFHRCPLSVDLATEFPAELTSSAPHIYKYINPNLPSSCFTPSIHSHLHHGINSLSSRTTTILHRKGHQRCPQTSSNPGRSNNPPPLRNNAADSKHPQCQLQSPRQNPQGKQSPNLKHTHKTPTSLTNNPRHRKSPNSKSATTQQQTS